MASAENYNNKPCKPSLPSNFNLSIVSLNPHFSFHPKRHNKTTHSLLRQVIDIVRVDHM